MSTHKICFYGEITKNTCISSIEKSTLSGVMFGWSESLLWVNFLSFSATHMFLDIYISNCVIRFIKIQFHLVLYYSLKSILIFYLGGYWSLWDQLMAEISFTNTIYFPSCDILFIMLLGYRGRVIGVFCNRLLIWTKFLFTWIMNFVSFR